MRERFQSRSSLFSQNRAILRLLAVLLSVFSSQMQVLSPGLWVLCAEMGAASRCVRGFRAVALFSQNRAILRLLAVLLSVFSCQMQVLSHGLWVLCAEMGVAWHILGAGEVSEP